jgi:hypothetical protein
MHPGHDMTRYLAALAASIMLAGCSEPEVDSPPEAPPVEQTYGWQTMLDDQQLDRVPLSVWGRSDQDGSGWHDLDPGGSETLWWVSGTTSSDVWMVGERGRIVHWNGSTFSEHDSGTTATMWGVFASSDNDVWAVGGTPLAGTDEPNDIVLHYDGDSWSPVILPSTLGVAHYKVWGSAADDIYVVGELGTIWHLRGDSWQLESDASSLSTTLFTVHGCSAEEIYVVGGLHLLRSAGDGVWQELDIELSSALNGVSCAGPNDLILAGAGGQKQRLVDGEWVNDYGEPPFDDLHAGWARGDGVCWVVGGDFLTPASPGSTRRGVVARYGPL